jgi:hypothetical protein
LSWRTTTGARAALLCVIVVSAAAAQEHHHEEHVMSMMSGPLGIPDSRLASGTAWQPDSTPMYGLHFMRGSWMVMAHWNVFAGYDHQSSDRGDAKWFSPNWGMLMEKRGLGTGALVFRQMVSLDELTIGAHGYPLLFQSGESVDGVPLHDKQHAHDLFMELAAQYTFPAGDAIAIQIYAAPVGEPALGPAAFPHRFSASSDPLAVLSHHWQDSTHISFGVLTAGLMTGRFKLEGSWFNGREPDDHRYDFDFRSLDSYSGRISFNPTAAWSLQVSYGYLASPDELQPDVSVHRLTASGAYNARIGDGDLGATAVFGRNESSAEPTTSSWLLEGNYDIDGKNVVFGRVEYVEKTGEDLSLTPALDADVFKIKNAVLGYEYRFLSSSHLIMGVGARGSINFIDDTLEPFYGSNHPAGFMVYVQLIPPEFGH